jgi:fasciclin domain-containing protein
MPAGQIDTLMNNTDALANFLRYHIAEGYYPYGALSGTGLGNTDIAVTNMDGKDLKLEGDISINEICMPFAPSINVINGTRIIPVSIVLMSPSQ